MHIVDIIGRFFISALFLIEAVRKFFEPDMSWTLPNYQSKESTTNENAYI